MFLSVLLRLGYHMTSVDYVHKEAIAYVSMFCLQRQWLYRHVAIWRTVWLSCRKCYGVLTLNSKMQVSVNHLL